MLNNEADEDEDEDEDSVPVSAPRDAEASRCPKKVQVVVVVIVDSVTVEVKVYVMPRTPAATGMVAPCVSMSQLKSSPVTSVLAYVESTATGLEHPAGTGTHVVHAPTCLTRCFDWVSTSSKYSPPAEDTSKLMKRSAVAGGTTMSFGTPVVEALATCGGAMGEEEAGPLGATVVNARGLEVGNAGFQVETKFPRAIVAFPMIQDLVWCVHSLVPAQAPGINLMGSP